MKQVVCTMAGKQNKNDGSTMVEVLVAVVVVMIMMGVLATAMTTVMDLWNRSNNRLQEIIAVDTDYYRTQPQEGEWTSEDVTFTLKNVKNGKVTSETILVPDVEMKTFRMENGAVFDLKLKD